jgi:hypothetical protein
LAGRRSTERQIANENQTNAIREPCHSTWNVASCELRCPSPALRNGDCGQPGGCMPLNLSSSGSAEQPWYLYRAATCGRRRSSRNWAQDAAAATLTLDIRTSARINTSRTNTATKRTKIILTCLCVLLISLLAQRQTSIPWHLAADSPCKKQSHSPPARVPQLQ